MKRPKRRDTSHRNDTTNELIRHHCEEISTHLGALKQLVPGDTDYGNGVRKALTKVGKAIKYIHTQHGGHPDA